MNFNAILLVGLFIPFTSAGKSDIKIPERSSWISSKNVSAMIDKLLNKSKCSFVYVSGDSVTIEILFNDFVNNYRSAYIIESHNYSCNGYFMISQSANELAAVVTTLPIKSSDEVLIIVDEDITESSLLFNVSIYRHTSVNIATRNGLWTLSENFLSPRIFKKSSRYDKKRHKETFANLQGRELRAASQYQRPFSYLRTTVHRTVDGIDIEFFENTNTNDTELDGVEVELFLLMAERLNFTWTIRKSRDTKRHRQRNGSTWNGGMIDNIVNKEVDIAFGNIWIQLNKSTIVEMTRPWTEGKMHFLVPRPKPYRSFWALTKPFSWKLWIAICVMMIAQSIYVYIKAWSIPNVPRRYRNYIVTFTELMGLLLGVWAPEKTQGLKAQLQLWQLIGILLVTSYSTNLAATLASFGYEKRIDTLKDFVAANLTWGRESPIEYSVYFDETDPNGIQVAENFHLEVNETERHEKIHKGNYAIFGKVIGQMFFPENDVREADLKTYRVMRRKTTSFYVTFVVQPWLLEPVNEVMLRLREAGLTQYQLDHVIYRNTGREYQEIFVEYDTDVGAAPRVLTLIPLGAAFSILFFGLIISAITFCIELKHVSGKKSILQIIRQINRNRAFWKAREVTKRRYPVMKSFKGPKYGFPLP